MEFLPCGYKINFILLKKWMTFKQIAVSRELTYSIVWGQQKLDIILENKVPPNLKLAKNLINKSCSAS